MRLLLLHAAVQRNENRACAAATTARVYRIPDAVTGPSPCSLAILNAKLLLKCVLLVGTPPRASSIEHRVTNNGSRFFTPHLFVVGSPTSTTWPPSKATASLPCLTVKTERSICGKPRDTAKALSAEAQTKFQGLGGYVNFRAGMRHWFCCICCSSSANYLLLRLRRGSYRNVDLSLVPCPACSQHVPPLNTVRFLVR